MRVILLLTALLTLPACATHRAHPANPEPEPTSGVLRLFSARSLGQGCPIADTTMLTARHVATRYLPQGDMEPVPVVWSDAGGHTGSAVLEGYDGRRDLARMLSDRPFHRWYPIATEAPTLDAPVQIVGYDYSKQLTPSVVRVRVLNIVSAHLVLSPGGMPGFSGSCVLDADGRVVGIFVGMVGTEASRYGLAVGVWGEWKALEP